MHGRKGNANAKVRIPRNNKTKEMRWDNMKNYNSQNEILLTIFIGSAPKAEYQE